MNKKPWVLLISIGVFWAVLAAFFVLSLFGNQGHFVYTLDDAYIHMAMAKNFSQHGVWGIDKYGFASTSSSPLWTLVLSGVYFLFGAQNLTPYLLNGISGTFACVLVYGQFRRHQAGNWVTFLVLLGVIFLTPLPILASCGLEHTVQILVDLLFVLGAAQVCSAEKPTRRQWLFLFLLAPAVVLTRFEGVFLVIAAGGLLAARKRFSQAMLLGTVSFFPIGVYGLISISKGWGFFPNSILLKGNLPEMDSWADTLRYLGYFGFQLVKVKHSHVLVVTLCIAIGLLWQYLKYRKFWTERMVMGTLMLVTIVMHMQFARTGWFFRYEAYLIAIGIVVAVLLLMDVVAERITRMRRPALGYCLAALAVGAALFPLAARSGMALPRIPRASNNIYSQQYQMGLFVKKYYPNKVVALNDIGAVNYLADIHCIDLWGLADMDILKAKQAGTFQTVTIAELCRLRHADIALVYDRWFALKTIGGLPEEWVPVGKWKIGNNIICGDDTVTFYAVDPSEAEELTVNLRRFSGSLPAGVSTECVNDF